MDDSTWRSSTQTLGYKMMWMSFTDLIFAALVGMYGTILRDDIAQHKDTDPYLKGISQNQINVDFRVLWLSVVICVILFGGVFWTAIGLLKSVKEKDRNRAGIEKQRALYLLKTNVIFVFFFSTFYFFVYIIYN